MKKKLLVFQPIIAPYRIDFFNSLADRYDISVCLFQRNLGGQKFDYLKIEKQLKYTPKYIIKNELGLFNWLRSVWNEISRVKPDIIFSSEFALSTLMSILFRFLKRIRFKIVCIVDDSYTMLNDNNPFTKRHKIFSKLLAPLVDLIINVEPEAADWYQSHYGKGIYFPIICDEKIARERQNRVLPISERYVREYGLENKRVFLFVGRLIGLKNVGFAIKAFVKADISDSMFIIVGSGEDECNLKALAAPYENIKLVGRFECDELYAWYNVAQIFTLPSTQEAFGAVTNEALVAGSKALVSKNAGSRCLIENGKNGFIIDPNDEKAYIEKIREVLLSEKPLCLPLTLKDNQMTSTFSEHIQRVIQEIDK